MYDTIPSGRRLVRVIEPVTDDADTPLGAIDDADTPLGVMIRILQGRYGHRLPVLHGEGYLTGFPVLEAVADGMLTVMYAMSSRLLDEPIRSSRELTQTWAARFDRVFQTALLLVYETPQRAAHAFERDVIVPVLTGAQPDWSRASAAFMAALLKEVRLLRESLESLEDELRRLLRGDRRLAGGSVLNSELIPNNRVYCDWLHVESEISSVSQVFRHQTEGMRFLLSDVVDLLRNHRFNLEAERVVVRALLQLPFSLRDLPESVFDLGLADVDAQDHVFPRWVETQMWLSLIEAPVALQHLTMRQYQQAVMALSACDDVTMCARFFERMEARGAVLDTTNMTVLQRVVREHHKSVRRRRNLLDPHYFQDLYIEVDIGEVEVEAGDALTMALGETADIVGEHARGRGEKRRLYDKLIVSKLNFSALTAEEIRQMVEAESVPVDLLARRLFEMPKPEADEAANWLLEEGHLTPEAFAYLEEAGLLSVDIRFIERAPALIPQERLMALLNEAFCLRAQGRLRITDITNEKMMMAVSRLTAHEVEELCETASSRLLFINFLDDATGEMRWDDASLTSFQTIRGHLRALGLWNLVALSFDVLQREAEYTGDELPADIGDDPVRSWDSSEPWTAQKPSKLIFATRADLDEAYRSYREDDVAAWLFAGLRDRKKRWRAYRAARDAYAKRFWRMPDD